MADDIFNPPKKQLQTVTYQPCTQEEVQNLITIPGQPEPIGVQFELSRVQAARFAQQIIGALAAPPFVDTMTIGLPCFQVGVAE